MIAIGYKDFYYIKNGLIASYNILGRFSPAVWKKKNGGYGIRIIKSKNFFNGSMEWDYFDLDPTGLIISSPRGMAKEYNKKCHIVDMDKAVEEYKDKVINQ